MTRFHDASRVTFGGVWQMVLRVGAIFLWGMAPVTAARSQQSQPLVFDGVTVIDVEHGARVTDQRVVVTGTRITAMGPAKQVKLPDRAQVIAARGKYMIPGLWDLHIHPGPWNDVFYSLFIANGITGVRDAGAAISLDTLKAWRQRIREGNRPGPARILYSGPQISSPSFMGVARCDRSQLRQPLMTCVDGPDDARHLVDSLKQAGADIIKTYGINEPNTYYAIASEARKLGMPFGGHLTIVPAADASDSGATLLDHLNTAGGLDTMCFDTWQSFGKKTIARCQSVAVHLSRNNTWFIPTLTIFRVQGVPISARTTAILMRSWTYLKTFWSDSAPANTGSANWLRGPVDKDTLGLPAPDSIGTLRIAQKVGLPMATGVDINGGLLKVLAPGFGTHEELAALVAEGLTPLTALQAATLNPAKAFRMTDSLGTVAVGKLADLVVLEADPLVDITNTTTISAVLANGRYYDRAALDRMLQDVRTSAMGKKLLHDENP